VNVQKWVPSVSTFAQAQTTLGGIALSNTTGTTSGAFSILTSTRFFGNLLRQPIQFKTRKRIALVANSTSDFGFGAPAGVTVPVNGVAIRITNGLAFCTIYQNSAVVVDIAINAETTLGSNTVGAQFSLLNLPNGYYTYDLICDDDNVVVTIQDTETGVMMAKCSAPVPASIYKMFSATALPVYDRVMNTGTPTT
jgi:hypothetical protein